MNKKMMISWMLLIILLISFVAPLGSSLKIHTKTIKEPFIETKGVNGNTFNLPSSFSWRDINGIDFTTPIRNQAPFHSCETFALVGAVETMVQYEVGYPFGCDLSEAHLFFYSGGNLDWGSYPENNTRFLQEYGIPDEACWPYPRQLFQYPLNTTSPDWQNRTVRIMNWSYLPEDPVAIKNALVTNGPVPTYFTVYMDFITHKRGIYKHKWGKLIGPHYVTIVGYNDEPGYWIVKNSWGTEYQDNGWFKIKYGECSIEKKSFYLTGVYGNFPIIYVDDDNIIGPWDGTIEYPYQYIQNGIDNAYEGYTVFVRNGTYYENVLINKTINLDGENKTNTIIDGSGSEHVIVISASNVRVSGFSIQHSGNKLFNAGIKTLTLDSNVTICNNIIQENDIGVFLNYAYPESWNIVKGNIIQNNRDGIYSHWANNNFITENIIQNNSDDGIEMECSQVSTISGNIINGNGECGIYLRAASNDNVIREKNTIEQNAIGINLDNSNKNIIAKNNFIDNQDQAHFSNSYLTLWHKNYWSDWVRFIPKPIKGHIGLRGFPWLNFDWISSRHPH
ncbi:MAG: right-handed parallel beta-helix repeat-containing protein [Thermoplasmatales archaeon]|nr:MAG: right-handed parallel beta-helix repeat-containing protein [Thermoplasmatales archaeon]